MAKKHDQFLIFLKGLPMTARDLIFFDLGCRDFGDLVSSKAAQLKTAGLCDDDLRAVRYALALDGLVMLDDDMQAVRSILSTLYKTRDLIHCKDQCRAAITLIDSLAPPAEADPHTEE